MVGRKNASLGELYRPDFARFLVDCGIDSMSLNPDAVLPTTRLVADEAASRPTATGA